VDIRNNPVTSAVLGVFWNGEEHRFRAFWRIILFFFLLTILTAPSILILSLGGPILFQFVPLLATVGALWIAGRILDRRTLGDFGLHIDRSWLIDLGFGLVLGALLMSIVFGVELLLGWITIIDTYSYRVYGNATLDQLFNWGSFATPSSDFLSVAFLFAVASFVSVGIYEEMISRGYLLRNMAEGFQIGNISPTQAVIAAWVISSALFGIAHIFNPNATMVSTFNIALAGIFLGLGFVLTNELAIPIGIHITWNLFQGNVYGFPVSGASLSRTTTIFRIEQGGPALWTGGAFGPEAGIIGILALVLGSGAIVWWVKVRYRKLRYQVGT
jgi:membrane protease YdiL (CAAX protease family)